jgi:hypothetical protein
MHFTDKYICDTLVHVNREFTTTMDNSLYHPQDFRKIKGRPLGGVINQSVVDKIEKISKARETTISVEVRRALREYTDREYPKLGAERVTVAA